MEDNTDILQKIYSECSIYPKPSPQKIQKEYNRVSKLTKNVKNENVSDDKIVENVCKALEVKKRLNTDSWIYYENKK